MRDILKTKKLCIKKEREKMKNKYMAKPTAIEGVQGYSALRNLPPRFSPTLDTYDFMYVLARCIIDLVCLLNGSLDQRKIENILTYEQTINNRYHGFSTNNFPIMLRVEDLNISRT